MLEKHKQPSLEASLLIILIVISVFTIGFSSEGKVTSRDKITGMAVEESMEKVTGDMVMVSGMAAQSSTLKYGFYDGWNNAEAEVLFADGRWKLKYKSDATQTDWTGWFDASQISNINLGHGDLNTLRDELVKANSEGTITKRYNVGIDKQVNFINTEGQGGWEGGIIRDDVWVEDVNGNKVAGDFSGEEIKGAKANFQQYLKYQPPPEAPSSKGAPPPAGTTTSAAPAPVSSSQPLNAPDDPESAAKLPTGKVTVIDGTSYYKYKDGSIGKYTGKNDAQGNGIYEPVIFKYNFKGKLAGETRPFNDIEAPTEAAARKKLADMGITSIIKVIAPSPTTATGEYQPREIKEVEIGGQTFYQDQFKKNYILKDGETDAEFRERIIKEDEAYTALGNIKKNNPGINDNIAKQILSLQNPDLAKAIGITPTKTTSETKGKKEVEKPVQLKDSDGNPIGMWMYKGKVITEDNKAEAFRQWKMDIAKNEKLVTSGFLDAPDGTDIFRTSDGTYKQIDDDGNVMDYSKDRFYKQERTIGPDKQRAISVYLLKPGEKTPTFGFTYIEDIGQQVVFDKETLAIISELNGKVVKVSGKEAVQILKNGEIVREVDITGYQLNGLGTRIVTDYHYVYFDAQGNLISESQHTQLAEQGKEPKSIKVELVTIEEFAMDTVTVKEGGLLGIGGKDVKEERRILKTYYSETISIIDKDIVIEGVKVNRENEALEFVYRVRKRDKDGNYEEEVKVRLDKDNNLIDENGKKVKADAKQQKILEQAKNRFSQFKSRRWFANFEFRLLQFRGLAGFSQLIFDDETLADWREGVDKIFSTLYLGTEYWTSGICSRYIPKDQQGLLTMRTKDGLFDVVAHVEGEKTTIRGPNSTEYIYKLTFSVRNPDHSGYDELIFNVYLEGERSVKLYTPDIEVGDGDTYTRGGSGVNPIVQQSYYNYDRICIRFKNSIRNADGDSEDEICNEIVEYAGGPTPYGQQTAAGAPATAGTSTQPFVPGDF